MEQELLTLFVSFMSNTADVTCGTGTVNPSGAPEFTPVLVGFVLLNLLFSMYWFGNSLFVLFLCALVLSVLRFTDSDYHFGNLQFFLRCVRLECTYLVSYCLL